MHQIEPSQRTFPQVRADQYHFRMMLLQNAPGIRGAGCCSDDFTMAARSLQRGRQQLAIHPRPVDEDTPDARSGSVDEPLLPMPIGLLPEA